MSKKEDALFTSWGEELASELETDEQDSLKAWLALPVAKEVFRGTLGQKEIARRMNEIHAEKEKLEEDRAGLQAWYDEEAPKNEALISERDALRVQLEAAPSGNPPPSAKSGFSISAEDLAELKAKAKKVDMLDKLIPSVLGDVAQVLKESARDGFDIDPREVIQVSLQKGIEPYRAYLEMTADERESRAVKSKEDELKKAFEAGRQSVQSNSPDHFQPSGPSVIDFIQELNSGKRVESTKSSRVGDALKELGSLGALDLS